MRPKGLSENSQFTNHEIEALALRPCVVEVASMEMALRCQRSVSNFSKCVAFDAFAAIIACMARDAMSRPVMEGSNRREIDLDLDAKRSA